MTESLRSRAQDGASWMEHDADAKDADPALRILSSALCRLDQSQSKPRSSAALPHGRSTMPRPASASSDADTCIPRPPYCTYGPHAPASCLLYVPEAQGSSAPGVPCVPHTLVRTAYLSTTYRGTTGEQQPRLVRVHGRLPLATRPARRRRRPSWRAARAASPAQHEAAPSLTSRPGACALTSGV